MYLASADWMPRNFIRRVEIAFPIEDPALRDELINEVLPSFLNDHVKARELQPDGTYVRLKPQEGETPFAGATAFPRTFAPPERAAQNREARHDDRKIIAHHNDARRVGMKKVLVIDIGGTNVKLMISRDEKRKFRVWPEAHAQATG